jgi:carbon storage regulator
MIVFTRREDEAIVIDHPTGKITIVVAETRGDRTRLYIEAPREVPVHCTEGDDDPSAGGTDSLVPRPSSPAPPSLGVHLDQPLPNDE